MLLLVLNILVCLSAPAADGDAEYQINIKNNFAAGTLNQSIFLPHDFFKPGNEALNIGVDSRQMFSAAAKIKQIK